MMLIFSLKNFVETITLRMAPVCTMYVIVANYGLTLIRALI